ncbi:hypothetical protein [Kutzneria sp. NPDC052558]
MLEALSGGRSGIEDPFLTRWGEDFAATVTVEAEAVLARCAEYVQDVS